MADSKTQLEEKDIPKAWYNIVPDLTAGVGCWSSQAGNRVDPTYE